MSETENQECSSEVSETHKDTDSISNETVDSLGVIGQNDSPVAKKNKVDILFKATGNAPIMKRRRWVVDNEKTVGWIISFLKTKVLHLGPSESLFLYVNQSFAPSPDQVVRNLYECFGTDGKLILHYCKTQAWG